MFERRWKRASGPVTVKSAADWIKELARQQGAWANIPQKRNRKV
jgi:hypothetical protein